MHPLPLAPGTHQLSSWVEVDGAAFESNVREIQELVRNRAKLCAVIKSDAYGHGAGLLMPFLARSGVPYIGVGSNLEAHIARRHGYTGKLMRVRAAAPQEIAAAVVYGVEELVADPQSAWEISRIAAAAGQTIRIHLDINSSGISRHSLDVSTALGRASAVGMLSHRHLELAGIMTHFPLDDVEDIEAGLARFLEQALSILLAANVPRELVLLHAANSFATLNVPATWLDMVRTGALLYGDSDPRHSNYLRCLAFKARIGSVNSYPAGSKVGYGHLHTLQSESRLATVTAGYGDGYRRALAKGGSVLVRGQRVPVVDAVSMNSMVVDVSNVADVCPGDEVVLFGRQGSEEITVDQLESATGSILADLYTVWAAGSRVLAAEGAV
ncbi:alanine racemase [Paenarthrobacter sp. NPDC018779]|uniref:alanine racemase n=1 Tax=Paenarthrobacter sp. NPDC018779 TaxID=3364375 RepID=UPI0037CC0D5D